VIAYHGEIKLASDIALESAAQVAAALIPAVVLVSWLIEPFPLAFEPVELVVLAGTVAIVAGTIVRGRSSRGRGLVLVSAYVVAAAAFFFAS
jgi:Ca2+:H+ antiporter